MPSIDSGVTDLTPASTPSEPVAATPDLDSNGYLLPRSGRSVSQSLGSQEDIGGFAYNQNSLSGSSLEGAVGGEAPVASNAESSLPAEVESSLSRVNIWLSENTWAESLADDAGSFLSKNSEAIHSGITDAAESVQNAFSDAITSVQNFGRSVSNGIYNLEHPTWSADSEAAVLSEEGSADVGGEAFDILSGTVNEEDSSAAIAAEEGFEAMGPITDSMDAFGEL